LEPWIGLTILLTVATFKREMDMIKAKKEGFE